MAVLEDLGAYLEEQGVGTVGTTIFYNAVPETPPSCLALFEYGGAGPRFTLPATTGIATESARVQVLVRSESNTAARAKAEEAYRALAKIVDRPLSSTRYLRVEPLQAPFFLRRDENHRIIMAFNVEVEKEPSA
jgi:hypothetical protein